MDLKHHGDKEIGPGLIDLAVNVRQVPMPDWLAEPIRSSLLELSRYPDDTAAREAIASRHGRDPSEVLLTAGGAQAFTLLAQGLRPRSPIVIHPQFTEPEAALLAAGHKPERVILEPPFTLDGVSLPEEADLVIVGNPTNPTSVLHPVRQIEKLAAPQRVLVVDEAFIDTIPGEENEVASRRDIPGLVAIRSLTKTWGLAGLRVGYVLAARPIIEALKEVAPLWPVSTPALAAAVACSGPQALREADRLARQLAEDRRYLVDCLGGTVVGEPRSSFVLVRFEGADRVRQELRTMGWAVRRGDTFPGLGPDWLRIAVRDRETTARFVAAWKRSSISDS